MSNEKYLEKYPDGDAPASLVMSYWRPDPEKYYGVRDSLYTKCNYNDLVKPLDDTDPASGGVTVTLAQLPDPISGKRIQLPSGDTTTTALGWAISGEGDNGLVRNAASDYGWYQSTVQMWRVTDSGFYLPQMTQGSVLFAGASGLVSQDNTNFFWDNTNKTLELTGASVTSDSLQIKVSGDSSPRLNIDADGSHTWTEAGQTSGQYLLKFITPNTATDPDFNISVRPFGNGFGSPIPNNHMAFGWNSGKDRLAPEDTSMPSFQLVFENYYLQSAGNPISEIYIEYFTASASPTSWRPWAAYVNQSSGVTNLDLAADTYSFYSRSTGDLIGQYSSTSFAFGMYNSGNLNTIVLSPETSQIYTTASGTPSAGTLLSFHAEGSTVGYSVYDTGAGSNAHHWEMFANGGSWTFRAANDAYNSFGNVFTVARSGVTVSSFTLATHLLFTDNTYDIGASGATRPRTIYPGTSVVFPTGGLLSWSTDLHLVRDSAANTLAQRNGTSAQVFRVYGTFTDASNYERFSITVGGGGATTIAQQQAGTGGARGMTFNVNGSASMTFSTNNTARWAILGTGEFLANTDNSLDIGLVSSFRPRTGYFGTGLNVANSTHVISSTSVVFNEPGGDVDFRAEGDNKASCLLLDASDDEVAIDGRFSLIDSTPAQITADQNDYVGAEGTATSRSTVWRLSSDASRNITGIGNPLQGRCLRLVNVGAQNIVIQNQNAGSSAANRIITGTGADITLAADDTMDLWYDSSTARWRVFA